MYFNDNVRGKIIINVNKTYDKLNSRIEYKGMAQKSEVALSALMLHFAEVAQKMGKNPIELLQKNEKNIENMLKNRGSQH